MLAGLAALVGLLPIAACSTRPVPERGGGMELSLGQFYRLPVTSLLGRRFETVVRQQYDFSCGSAALATLLHFHYGDRQSEQSVFIGMFRNGNQPQIRRLGFSLLDMKRYLESRGISADGYRVTLDQIARSATPGIALIDFNGYKHFVVVKGIQGDTLLLGDPSLGLRRESIGTFAKQWNGIYFAINNPAAPPGSFNRAADIARAPSFRWARDARAVDLSALALTRPLPGEF